MTKLRKKDIQILETLVKCDTVKMAAQKLGVDPQILHNWSYRMRRKKVESRKLINVLLGYQKRSHLIARILSPRGTEYEED